MRFARILAYATPLLLAVALYGYALRLPYFLDDGPHFAILAQTDGLIHWGEFAPFPFYRPFTFTVWKLFEPSGYPALLLHALNVFAFGLSATLTGQIARMIAPRRIKFTAGMIAGCAVVLFPFSYGAVAMVAALFHLTLALGVGLCLWAALRYQVGGGTGWLMLCVVGAFVAAFSHESGAVLALLLPAALLIRSQWDRRAWRVVLPVWGIVGVYVLLWWRFSPNDEARTLSAEALTATAALSQGLAYPFVALLRPSIDGDAPAVLLLGFVALVVAALLGIVWRIHRDSVRAMAYGLLWYALAIAPAVVFLPAGYVLGQLRLSLLASLGAAILWGVGLAVLLNVRRLRLLACFVIVLAVFVSVDFLSMRRADLLRLAAWNAEAVAIAPAGTVALVNPPMFTAPVDANRRFLLGSEGVLWTDETLDYRQQFALNGDSPPDRVIALTAPDLLRGDSIRYTPHGDPLDIDRLREADHIIVTMFTPDGRYLPVLVGGESVAPANAVAVDYPQIGGALRGADWHMDGGHIVLRTRWHLAEPASVTVFAHVVCDGVLIAQGDGYVWGETYPFRLWRSGETADDRRVIHLPPDVDAGCVGVLVGLYDVNSGERLAAHLDGERLPDDAFAVMRHESIGQP